MTPDSGEGTPSEVEVALVRGARLSLGITERRGLMATYDQTRQDVWRHSGFDPKTCWIAHVKELHGLPVRRASNRRGSAREVPCPDDKKAESRDREWHGVVPFGVELR